MLSIFIVIGGMTFASFSGLQNTVKMNEYMLSLEQDIRAIQRSSMLLERDPDEYWLYGLGIYFSGTGNNGTGEYQMFKWCSGFRSYGDPKTKSDLPAYDPDELTGGPLRNAWLPYTDIESISTCNADTADSLVILSGYDVSLTPPKAVIDTNNDITYVVFESISGRAFFYNSSGELVNYDSEGNLVDIPVDFQITVSPVGMGKTRILSIGNLSGKITLSFGDKISPEEPEGDGPPAPDPF